MADASRPTNELLQSAIRGNDEALGELIEQFRPVLCADATRNLAEVRGRIGASDVVQLTWWSAFRAFPRFEGDVDAFIGWLRNIHGRNIQDAVRDQHADKRAIRREVSPSDALQNAKARITSPSQKLVRNEQLQQMESGLEQLPAAQREAIRLRFYESLSVTEIVERMGRSETSVAGLLKRGLSSLRKMMNQSSDESRQG